MNNIRERVLPSLPTYCEVAAGVGCSAAAIDRLPQRFVRVEIVEETAASQRSSFLEILVVHRLLNRFRLSYALLRMMVDK